jgi:hypothetical protein
VSVKLDAVRVLASIDREKVAVTAAPVDTPVAPDAGEVDVTVGGEATVVNDQFTGVSGVPSLAWIEPARFATYVVPPASGALGVNVAVFVVALYETVAGTAEPPVGLSVKLELVIVEAFMSRENVALTVVPVETSVASPAGDALTTAGGGVALVDRTVASTK